MPKDPPGNFNIKLPKDTRVIACEVFKDELKSLGIDQSDCFFLEQGLHRSPEELNKWLAQAITRIEKEYSPGQIILVYGYCGGGLENISTTKATLILAKAHDCITLFLGNEPERIGANGKGIFHLSSGWIKFGKNPYTEYLELKERLGHDEALWSCKEQLKKYGHVVFIHTVPDLPSEFMDKSKTFAGFFGMEHSETQGDPALLINLLNGRPGGKILKFNPQQKISRKDFE